MILSRSTLVGYAAAFTVVGIGAATRMPRTMASPTTLVFDHVIVVDVERGTLLSDQRVVIASNHIQAVGDTGTVERPADATVVDARGKYLIPGLWDMHVHPVRYTDLYYPMFVAMGVTGIRDAGSPVPLDTLTLWRREIWAGTRIGPPRQLLSGQSIAGPSAGCDRRALRESTQTCVVDSLDARHYVDSIRAAGADIVKPRDLDKTTYLVVADEARRLGMRFGGHAPAGMSVLETARALPNIIDHAMGPFACWEPDRRDLTTCAEAARQFRQDEVWFVPTLTVSSEGQGAQAEAIVTRFREQTQTFWGGSLLHGNWLALPAPVADSSGLMDIIRRADLPILAGTDTPLSETGRNDIPGMALHAELAVYVANGLTPAEALRAATLNPARFLHATDSLGTIAAGKLADLVLLDANPLADITNTTAIRAVVANGRYFDRAALDSLLVDIQRRGKTRLKNEEP